MASFDTTLYGLQKTERTTTPTRLPAPNQASGQVEFAVIPYTLTGTEAAADTINLCVLPGGIIPVPALSSCVCVTDPGTAWTLKVGTAELDTGWAASVAMTVPGKVEFCAASATQPGWLTPTKIAADTADGVGAGPGDVQVYATVITATGTTASTVMYFILAYKRNA